MSQNDLRDLSSSWSLHIVGRLGQGEPPESSDLNLGERLPNLQVLLGQQHVGRAPAVFIGAGPPRHSSSA